MLHKLVFIGLLLINFSAQGVTYDCDVDKKVGHNFEYTKQQIQRAKFRVVIQEDSSGAFLSRCSVSPSEGSASCDKYAVDKVIFDKNVKLKKYFVFNSQFDVQLFANLSFVENNGRGDIAFGKCKVVSP